MKFVIKGKIIKNHLNVIATSSGVGKITTEKKNLVLSQANKDSNSITKRKSKDVQHYGTYKLTGRWGPTHVIWAISRTARKSWFDLGTIARMNGLIKKR